jgi:hypothetical protein
MLLLMLVENHAVQNDVQILAPVIQLRDVHLLQGVVNCQGMETEDSCQDGLFSFDLLVLKVNPEEPVRIGERRGKILRLEAGSQAAIGIKI